MTDAKVQQKLGNIGSKPDLKEQFESLTPGDQFRYNGKQPLTTTNIIQRNGKQILICRGPGMGRHRLTFVGSPSDPNLVEIGETPLSIEEPVESFEIVNRQDAEDSSRFQLSKHRDDVYG